MVNVNYQYGMGGSYMGRPVTNTTYGQYNYYTQPQTIGNPIDGSNTAGQPGGGSSSSQTGNADAETWFKDVMAGKNLPFSPFQKSQMLSQQSDMSAAAEGARNAQLMGNAAMGGASAGDPSLNAARMSNMAARQTQNQTAARDIDTQANTANFGAQMNAASQLNQNAMQRAQWAQAAASGAGVGMAFSPWGSGQGGDGGGGGQSGPFGGYHGSAGQQYSSNQYNTQLNNIQNSAALQAQGQMAYQQELQRLKEDQAWANRPRR